ncbi:MAG: hypothetical protein ACREMA_10795, partial [Longimicrobiales bacterium]
MADRLTHGTPLPDRPADTIPDPQLLGRLSALVDELRGICGESWVYTHEHQLRTYESDALLQY